MRTIELSHLHKQFGDHVIFEDFSLVVEQAEMLAVVGPSGCGKSTLLNILGLIESYDDGQYHLFGQEAPQVNTQAANQLIRQHIAFLFQNFALIDHETVAYNLKLAMKYAVLSAKEQETAIAKALETVGLSGYEQNKIYTCSGGQQQRIALARCMVKPCDLILADEPTGSVDQGNRDRIIQSLKILQAMGKTILLVSHDPAVAKQCDREVHIGPAPKTEDASYA